MVKNMLAMQETQEIQVRSLGQEDPLEEEMAIESYSKGKSITRLLSSYCQPEDYVLLANAKDEKNLMKLIQT